MFRSTKAILGFGAVAAATLAATASLALAQAGPADYPDNDPNQPPPNLVVTNCGANQSSIVRTQNAPSTISDTSFVQLPGATTTITVPPEESRCVKVLLTAESACGLSAAADFCYVQATLDGAPMNPNGLGFQALDSEDGSASAHAYEWIKRVGAGNHTIRIERRVGNAATAFYMDDWTFDVETSL